MKTTILIVLILNVLVFSQNQTKIEWPSLADTPWPVLRGDMQGTGRSEYIGPSTANVIWEKDMPLGIVYGPIIGFNDMLFMGERALTLDTLNYFYALDKSGNNLWTFTTETESPNNVGPVIGSDSTIYFGSKNGFVYALNIDGSLKWKTGKFNIGFQQFISLAKNGNLYFSSADSIYILSPDGEILKQKFVDRIFGQEIVFSTEGDQIFYFTGGNQGNPGTLESADIEGNVHWTYHFSDHPWGVPVVDNDNRVYVFGRDSLQSGVAFLFCFNRDGNINWKYPVWGYTNSSAPTIDKKGNIIFHALINDGSIESNAIIALNYNGEENWITILDVKEDFFNNYVNHGLVCDAEGKIYFGTTLGTYFGCISSEGEILWTIDLDGNEFDGSPAIGSDGTLYIGTHQSAFFRDHKRTLIAVRDETVSIGKEQTVKDFHLYQNYPNPFNPRTTIKFAIPETRNVTLKIYDILGNEIETLLNEEMQAGIYETEFSAGSVGDGSELSSGVYIYKLTAGSFNETKKLLLMK